MSSRNIRKLQGGPSLPIPADSSDEDYEPLYVKKLSRSTYAGLEISSNSETECRPSETSDEDKYANNAILNKKAKKKNKRKSKKSSRAKHEDSSQASNENNLDDIDKCVLEVNAMLGEPSKPIVEVVEVEPDSNLKLFAIKYTHLTAINELNRKFGPDSEEETGRRRGRRPNLKVIHKYTIISKEFSFKRLGLSMSMERRDDGLAYFIYKHNIDYQRRHREFLSLLLSQRVSNMMMPIETSLHNMHIEGLIEGADMLFRTENYSAANDIIEKAIAYLQYVAHPSFNLTDPRTRLEYKYVENRSFHILILKYLHLLSNRACHRTGMELAKMLLNLDPSDPLGVILIIDALALRAREHGWLIQAVDFLDQHRDVGYMFNIKFSYAMAHFHVATDGNADMKHADELLQEAFLAYPGMFRTIILTLNHKVEESLSDSDLFHAYASETTSSKLKDLMKFYAAFTATQWRERPVLDWFLRNARELLVKFEDSDSMKEKVVDYNRIQQSLFRSWPEQIHRHLVVISPMSELLVDGAVPEVTTWRSYNPVPPQDGESPSGYRTLLSFDSPEHNRPENSWIIDFFASLMPDFGINQNVDDELDISFSQLQLVFLSDDTETEGEDIEQNTNQ